MNFKDTWAENEDGEKFVFTVEMQRSLSQRGLPVDPSNLNELDMPSPRPVSDMPVRAQAEPQTEERPRVVREEFDGPATIQIDPETGKYIGRMKWYNVKKGYGFIVRGGGEEIFFHKTGAAGDPNELRDGQWILYDVEETHKGPEATDVEPYEGDVELLS